MSPPSGVQILGDGFPTPDQEDLIELNGASYLARQLLDADACARFDPDLLPTCFDYGVHDVPRFPGCLKSAVVSAIPLHRQAFGCHRGS